MGQNLDRWLEANSAALSRIRGEVPPQMQPGFGAPQAPAPSAAPRPGFPTPMGPGGAGTFAAAGGGQPAFAPQAPSAPVAAPVTVGKPEPTIAKTQAPKPRGKGGKPVSFSDMYDKADKKSITKAIDLLEKTTGQSVEDLYQQQTGNPPPRGTKKEKIGEFLLEFGLNLMSVPAGEDSFSSVGRSAQAALATGRQRDEQYAMGLGKQEEKRIAREDRALGRLDKAFDREIKTEELALQRQKVQADMDRSVGNFENYIGDDGYMYTYNEETGEGRRVMVNGKPVKPDPRQNKSKQQRFDTEVRYNLYMDVHGKDAEGNPLAGANLKKAREGALKFSNREREYTKDEARRDAVKQATTVLSKLPDFTLATPEEQKVMLEEKVDEYTELLMYGSGPGQGQPDPSRLSEGVATPVTNDSGVTEYWTIRDGSPVKVSENELQQ